MCDSFSVPGGEDDLK